MAIYEIETEDGSLYEVETDEGASSTQPSTTGSFSGDLLDTIGGVSKGALEGIGGAFFGLGDLGGSVLASGYESVKNMSPTWVSGTPMSDLFQSALDEETGTMGQMSSAGRIAHRGGELGGDVLGILAGGGAVKNAPGVIGKLGKFISSNPLRQLELATAGGLAGQAAVEGDLVEQGGLGQLGVELATMTAPDLLRAGVSGAKGLGRYFYQGGNEAANEVMGTVAKSLDDASVLTRPSTSASGQVSREELLGDLVKTARNVAGQQKEEALNAVSEISSESSQLTDELSALKKQRWAGTLDPKGADRIKQIEGVLEAVPATRVADEGFPLLNEKYGDFVKGTAKVVESNPLRGAIDNLASKKAEFSEMANDLYKVFRTGKYAGRGVSLDDYQQAASKIGRTLTNGQTAKTFKEVMGGNPEALSLGKASLLQETFSGTPTSWLGKINKNRGAFQELFEPEQLKALEKIASKNKGVVGGAIIASAARFLDNRFVRYGILGSSATFGGPVGILGAIALNKMASAVARKPDVMQQAISAAFQNPKIAELMIKDATPRNIKTAVDYLTKAGKSVIMGLSADDGGENETDRMDTGFIPEKKSEEIKQPTPDVDLTPKEVENKLPEKVIRNVIAVESGFNKDAVGPETKYGTAKGLMQLVDSTGREWHKKLGLPGEYDPFNEEQNKAIGTAYLNWLSDRFDGDLKLALAAYNWGIGNVRKALTGAGGSTYEDIRSKLPRETRVYVKNIIKNTDTGEV
jgi:hypothetical protein